jgi:NAD(P)-dependent dehydrogenase (short-subunit alcohol dehydrogenase family)
MAVPSLKLRSQRRGRGIAFTCSYKAAGKTQVFIGSIRGAASRQVSGSVMSHEDRGNLVATIAHRPLDILVNNAGIGLEFLFNNAGARACWPRQPYRFVVVLC